MSTIDSGHYPALSANGSAVSPDAYDIVAKSAGLMGGYGLHLWPFLQDLGQLKTLYGENLSDTFFGNADAQIFFGNSDVPTLDYVSRRLGVVDVKEIGKAPTMGSGVNPITGATVGALLSGNSKHTKMGGAIVGGAVGRAMHESG